MLESFIGRQCGLWALGGLRVFGVSAKVQTMQRMCRNDCSGGMICVIREAFFSSKGLCRLVSLHGGYDAQNGRRLGGIEHTHGCCYDTRHAYRDILFAWPLCLLAPLHVF